MAEQVAAQHAHQPKEEASHPLMQLARRVQQKEITLDDALETVQQPNMVTRVDESQLKKLANEVLEVALFDRQLAWILARLLDTIAPYVTGLRLQTYCALRVAHLGRGSGNESLALERAKHALTLSRTLGIKYRREEGYALLRIGDLLCYQRLNDDALTAYEQALTVLRDVQERVGYAHVLLSKGNLLESEGKRDEALLSHEEALDIYRTDGTPLMQANVRAAIGRIYAFQNKVSKALGYYNDALTLYRAERDQLGEANTLMRIGELQASPDERLEFHQQALKLFRVVGDRLGEAQSLLRIADIQLSKESYSEALKLYRAVGDRHGEGDVLLMQGRMLASQERHDEALRSYNEALKLFHSAGIDWGQIRVHQARGQLFGEQEAYQKAYEEYQKALIFIEDLRHLQQWEGSRRHLAAEMAGYYQEMVALCLDMKRLSEAWYWAERGKGRTMLELLGSTRPRLETPEQRDIYSEWKSIEQEMFELDMRSRGQRLDTPYKTALSEELAKKRQEEAQKREELLRLLDQGRELIQVEVPQPKELTDSLRHLAGSSGLGQRTLLIEYFFLEPDHYAVFLLPLWQEAPKLLVHSEKLPDGTVQQVMASLMAGLEAARNGMSGRLRGETPAEAATLSSNARQDAHQEALKRFAELPEKVGQAFVQPWAENLSQLSPTELILVPHGALHLLPLHLAKLADGRLLIEEYPLVYLPNAAIAGTLLKRRQADHKPTGRLVMGPPGTDLPYSEMESKRVAQIWKLEQKEQPYTHSKMEIEQLKRVASSSEGLELLHLATHSSFDVDDYLQSHILFHNERLTLTQLISDERLDFHGLRLCYLSSCESGIARSDGGDELQGLVWSLVYAGANAVMASLWPVYDKAGLRMAQRFYYYSTKKRRSLIKAYHLALRDLRKDKDFENPFFWAPFVLFGNGWQKTRR